MPSTPWILTRSAPGVRQRRSREVGMMCGRAARNPCPCDPRCPSLIPTLIVYRWNPGPRPRRPTNKAAGTGPRRWLRRLRVCGLVQPWGSIKTFILVQVGPGPRIPVVKKSDGLRFCSRSALTNSSGEKPRRLGASRPRALSLSAKRVCEGQVGSTHG